MGQQVGFVDKAGGVEVFESQEQEQDGGDNLGGNSI